MAVIRIADTPTLVKDGFWSIMKKDFIKYKYIYIMLIPVILYYVVFHYIPMGGAIIAFQNYKPARGFFHSTWVGFDNFKMFLTGPYAVRVILNTIILSFWQIVFSFPAPIILALMINELKNMRYKKLIQTISYMPHFISLVVICGLIINFVKSDGIITNILVYLGMKRVNLLSDSSYFRTIFISSGIWQNIGWGSIIYLATLSNVDPNLYEAAVIDGAGRFRQIYHITIPALVPIMTIQLIMRIGNMVSQGSEKVLLLYNPLIYDKSDIISTFVYRAGLIDSNYSFAAAVGIFNSVINLLLLISANWFSKKFVNESLW